MYHDERVINGVLHYRTSPNGTWFECSLQMLTAKVLVLKGELEMLRVGDASNDASKES